MHQHRKPHAVEPLFTLRWVSRSVVVTVPAPVLESTNLRPGDLVTVRADGEDRVIVERYVEGDEDQDQDRDEEEEEEEVDDEYGD